MSRKRYVVECIWSGYRSSQSRPCHRTVETVFVDTLKEIHTVQFTDNTTMSVTVRPCEPRERVKEIHGYDSLLRDIIMSDKRGFVRVADLHSSNGSGDGLR